jgi:hypothetical protein
MHHSIRIDHRKDLEDEVAPERLSYFIVGGQKGNEMMHDPTRNRLTCMRAGQQHNYRQNCLILPDLLKVSNRNEFKTIPNQSRPSQFPMKVCQLPLID